MTHCSSGFGVLSMTEKKGRGTGVEREREKERKQAQVKSINRKNILEKKHEKSIKDIRHRPLYSEG